MSASFTFHGGASLDAGDHVQMVSIAYGEPVPVISYFSMHMYVLAHVCMYAY